MRLFVHEWGDPAAPPVVCLHGVQAYGGRFRRLAEDVLARRFRVLAPDLRGHGRSGWDAPWTLAAHVDDLLETFRQRAAWVGHSFGGRLVAELLAARPELVERAVLLDPALVLPPDYLAWLAEAELAIDVSFADSEEALAQAFAGRRREQALEAEELGHLERGEDGRFRFHYSREAVAAAYRALATPPPPWTQARVRTLVVVGAESKFVSVGEAEAYRTALGERLSLVVVPGGHMVLWDGYTETAAAVDGFL